MGEHVLVDVLRRILGQIRDHWLQHVLSQQPCPVLGSCEDTW